MIEQEIGHIACRNMAFQRRARFHHDRDQEHWQHAETKCVRRAWSPPPQDCDEVDGVAKWDRLEWLSGRWRAIVAISPGSEALAESLKAKTQLQRMIDRQRTSPPKIAEQINLTPKLHRASTSALMWPGSCFA